MDDRSFPTAETLGQVVRTLRELLGMSAEELAQRVQLPTEQVSDLEHGRLDPSLDVLLDIAHGLGVTMTTLCRMCEHHQAR